VLTTDADPSAAPLADDTVFMNTQSGTQIDGFRVGLEHVLAGVPLTLLCSTLAISA
jgi:hypothetical protein